MTFLYLFYFLFYSDRYQVIGRNVHMDFVQEHLRTKKNVDFGDSQERSNNIELEILADTVYVKVWYITYTHCGIAMLCRGFLYMKEWHLIKRN